MNSNTKQPFGWETKICSQNSYRKVITELYIDITYVKLELAEIKLKRLFRATRIQAKQNRKIRRRAREKEQEEEQ